LQFLIWHYFISFRYVVQNNFNFHHLNLKFGIFIMNFNKTMIK
jgi:hypothetical protein